jgi:hypothetical protein
MDERVDAWTSAAVNVLYALALAAMIFAAVPQLRDPLTAAWRAQLYAWRRGRWLGPASPPPPQWRRWLAREDLPQERA